jgi:predicted nucleic acid-binding protein
MSDKKAFIDTNIFLYLLSEDTDKAERVREILHFGWIISVQVLNEIAGVTRRKPQRCKSLRRSAFVLARVKP